MELGFLLLVAASFVCGLALRRFVGLMLGRILLSIGLSALIAGLGILALVVAGVWVPFGPTAGGLATVLLLGVSMLVLPFAVAARWGRSRTGTGG